MIEVDNIESEKLKVKDAIYLDDCRDSMLRGFERGYELGQTTYFRCIDSHFRFLKSNVIIFGGYGNHGKSTFLYQLALLQSLKMGDKWAIFSPENLPADFFYNDLIHTLIGKSTILQHKNKMTKAEYVSAMDFIREHFFLIYPENDSPNPQYINERFEESIKKHGVTGCITDPFNQLDRDWEVSGRDDKYISDYLNKEKRFAQLNNVYKVTVAHCHSRITFEDDGTLKTPNVYSLAGGAMWSNKADDIVFIHRPYKHSDPLNTNTTFISDKIKKQRICGTPGEINLEFNPQENRYYGEDGENPFGELDDFIREKLK